MPDALVACTLFVYWRYMLIEAVNFAHNIASLPAWGVRVEITPTRFMRRPGTSLPAWGVRVEIPRTCRLRRNHASLPAWGVRVEIGLKRSISTRNLVTPRMGSAG